MGCVTSKLFCKEFENETKASKGNEINNSKKNHTVSLTSSTYGLLNLDKPNEQITEEETTTKDEKKRQRSSPPRETKPEVINAWELMEGLEEYEPESPTKKKSPNTNTTRSILLKGFADIDPRSPLKFLSRVGSPRKSKTLGGKENRPTRINNSNSMYTPARPRKKKNLLFEKDLSQLESPAVVIYTTTLRGIRKTFEDCNKVRSAMKSQGVRFSERDVSMDSGFKEELRRVTGTKEIRVPAVFVKGVAIVGEEVIRLEEEGKLGILLEGLPRMQGPERECKGCGEVRFVVCGECHGSCKVAVMEGKIGNENVVKKNKNEKSTVRCLRCNENGLVHCPLCRF